MEEPIDDGKSRPRLGQSADVPGCACRRRHAKAVDDGDILVLKRSSMDLDAARPVHPRTRRTGHHDECVRTRKRYAVPPSRRMTGQHRIGRQYECRCLAPDPVIDADARNHVNAVQNAPKLRAKQSSTADQAIRQGVTSTKRPLAKSLRYPRSFHPAQGAATAHVHAEPVHSRKRGTNRALCAQRPDPRAKSGTLCA